MSQSDLYLVDTSAWVFALRKRPQETIRQRIDRLLELGTVATCGLVELELLGGALSEQEFARLEMRLWGLHRLPTDEADWNSAARLAFSLRRAGVTVPFADLLLAALALRHEAILVHADRDFDLIANHSPLRVESLVGAIM